MPSQFFGLNIAYTGLLASNAALNTTSNNISNVQTQGYSRQQTVQQASNALRVFQTYGCAGAGVETLAIERIRDEFYDVKYWNNNAKVGEYGIKEYYMKQVETYFQDDGKAGFSTIFDQLMTTGLQEWMKDADSEAAKSQFIGYASSLAEYFNGLAGNLEALQKDINQEIKLKIDEVNSLAGEIATLNKQINVIELGGGAANELRDRRALLLDQLSEIVDVDVTEHSIQDANDPGRETGGTRYIVKIAGGQILVDGSEYNGLECVAKASYEKVNQTDIDGLYDVYWENGQQFNLNNTAMGGALQGLIQMRDGNNAESFAGRVVDTGTTPDGKQDTVTIQVGKSYLQDLNKCNLSDQGGIINLGNQEFYYDSWEYNCTYDENGEAVYTYTFTLADNNLNDRRLTNDRVGKEASIGASISYQGIPYYMSQMNEWIRTFSQKFNDILASGYDSYGNAGSKLFTGDSSVDSDQFKLEDDTRYDTFYSYDEFLAQVDQLKADNPGMTDEEARAAASLSVSVADDSYYRLTAKNFNVLSAMLDDSGLLANRKDSSDGVSQDDLLEDLNNLATDKDVMSFRGCSASEFLQCVLADVALNASRANTFYATYSNMASAIDNQRLSISGVDEDEEAVNLVKFQNGYNLASKMIQILTEVYDRLILQTGV